MLLKTFEKVCSETKVEYVLFDKNGEYVDSFVVDYCDKYGRDNIMRKIALEEGKATVRHVHFNTATHMIEVSVTV